MDIEKIEPSNIPLSVSVIEAWRAHIILHLMKQVEIIHQLMKHSASTTLQQAIDPQNNSYLPFQNLNKLFQVS